MIGKIAMNNHAHQFKIVRSSISTRHAQSGVIMLVALISLVIMLLASIALIRSTDANLMAAGNLSFRRDVVNQAERAIPQIVTIFTTGALSTDAARIADSPANNYSATILAGNTLGIPTGLSTMGTNLITNVASGIQIQYLIDRMCLSNGPVTPVNCSLSKPISNQTGSKGGGAGVQGGDPPIYRISIHATGPRNTETYIQTTFSF